MENTIEDIAFALSQSKSYLIKSKIEYNESEYNFCIEFISNLIDKEGFTISEGISHLELYLIESEQY